MSQKKARSLRRAIRERESHAQFASENAAIAVLAGITLVSRTKTIDGFIAPGNDDFPSAGLVCLSLSDAHDVARVLFALASDSTRAELAKICFFAAEQLAGAVLDANCECGECDHRICVELPHMRAVAELLHALSDSARDAGFVCDCFAASQQLAELFEKKHA